MRAGVRRIVMASTSGTIAVSRREDDVADETVPTPIDLIGRWPYYASKHYQEETARRACGDKVELVTVNPSLLLGPGDDRLSSTRFIVQFIARDIALMPAGGTNVVDARDVAALLPVAMARGTAGDRYLVGAVNWSFADLFGRLERLTEDSRPEAEDQRRAAAPGVARAGGAVQAPRAQGPRRADQRRPGAVLLVLRRRQGRARAGLRPARSRRHPARHRQLRAPPPAGQRRASSKAEPARRRA